MIWGAYKRDSFDGFRKESIGIEKRIEESDRDKWVNEFEINSFQHQVPNREKICSNSLWKIRRSGMDD